MYENPTWYLTSQQVKKFHSLLDIALGPSKHVSPNTKLGGLWQSIQMTVAREVIILS